MELECMMFEISFQRPKNFFKLTSQEQWTIDAKLGILDWEGIYMTEADIQRFKAHYE